MTARVPAVVLGAGPAGLGAAWRLARRGSFEVQVIERQAGVGGNAGSFELDGVPVDFGSHRLHPSCSPEILADLRSMMGADLLERPRHGRIRLLGRWLRFPLRPLDLALHAPPSFLTGVAADAVRKRSADPPGETFETVLLSRLGRTICRDFYFPYARKIWGVEPSGLDAEQARRRVSAASFTRMARKVLSAVPGLKPPGAGRFYYPRGGFGRISEAYRRACEESGVRLRLRTSLQELRHDGRRVHAVVATSEAGGSMELPASMVLSTIPLTALVRAMSPAAPPDVAASATALRYRSMILIYLVLRAERFTEFDAHYFPEASIPITRLSEPKNYGLASAPGATVLCAELPCDVQDAVWTAADEDLGALVCRALETAELPIRSPLVRVVTRRLSHAYPIYTLDYREHFDRLTGWVDGFEGLVTLGRQGLFAHDNTHHTLAMAYAAAECISAAGDWDRERWASHRRTFEHHVVED